MTITTLVGLTQEELDKARKAHEHEYFQLEEITRHYELRMYRREQKAKHVRFLAFNTPAENGDKWKRRWSKLDELDRADAKDRAKWHAGMDRQIELSRRWNEMWAEMLKQQKATA